MTESAIKSIVLTIAEAEGTEPEDLEMCLQDHTDLDAIQEFMDHENDSWQLQFETDDHVVLVRGNGTVRVDDGRWQILSEQNCEQWRSDEYRPQ